MTDNRNLFSTLISIYRRAIKMRGGLLYTDYINKITFLDKSGGTLDLRHVLYILKLKASLMLE